MGNCSGSSRSLFCSGSFLDRLGNARANNSLKASLFSETRIGVTTSIICLLYIRRNRAKHKARSKLRSWKAGPGHDERLHRRLAVGHGGAAVPTDRRWIRSVITTTLHDRITGFAQLIKVYRASQEGEARYSPAEVSSVEVVPIVGQPDPDRICTSIVERSNLSLRMGLRRFTRLTNAFSKSFANHWAAVILWYCWYNFGPVHKSLRTTPAMAAGISDHVWSVREILEAA